MQNETQPAKSSQISRKLEFPSSCVLCGADNFRIVQEGVRDLEYGAPGMYRWIECTGCGLIHIDPRPSSEVLALAYPSNYNPYVQSTSKILQFLTRHSRQWKADTILKRLRSGDSVLEVGCSTGELLAALRSKGEFSLYGVEYNSNVASQARLKGFKVWQDDFEEAHIPLESFDVIIMNHVLEHVSNCVHTLEKTYQALKPGGYLLGEIPNMSSWDARLFGKYWGGTHAPRHIWNFSTHTLMRLFKDQGFEVIKIGTDLKSGHLWALSVQNWFRRHRQSHADLRDGRTWYYPVFLIMGIPLHLLQGWFSQGGIISFVVRKPFSLARAKD